jgi:DNA gyrase subunit A
VTGHTTRDEDEVLFISPARTLQTVLFFSDIGKVYSERVHQIPDADRTGKGVSIYNVLSLGATEHITAAIAVPDFGSHNYFTLVTRRGRIKRVGLQEFAAVRPSGLIAMTLDGDDELGWARLTTGQDEIIFVTERGQALRFREDAVRVMGRSAAGVQGIRLATDDYVTSFEVVEKGGALLVVTERGFGKQTPLGQYPAKGRATSGVATIDQKARAITGKIASARVVQPSDDLTIISTGGIILRLKVRQIKEAGRATRGVRMMKLGAEDSVAEVARIASADLWLAGAADGNGQGPADSAQETLL